jgi:hypothetical protein
MKILEAAKKAGNCIEAPPTPSFPRWRESFDARSIVEFLLSSGT